MGWYDVVRVASFYSEEEEVASASTAIKPRTHVKAILYTTLLTPPTSGWSFRLLSLHSSQPVSPGAATAEHIHITYTMLNASLFNGNTYNTDFFSVALSKMTKSLPFGGQLDEIKVE
jgi:hypothetical protein